MRSHRAIPDHGSRTHERAVEDRGRLVTALRGADLGAAATVLAGADTASTVLALDDARNVLLLRLLRRSNDFGATTALKALDTFTADSRADDPSGAPGRLARQGQAGTQSARRWLHLGGAT